MSSELPLNPLPESFPGVLAAIARTASHNPNHPALIDQGRAMSYAELMARVRVTTRHAGACGDRVAVLAYRCADTLIAMLGIWAAGGVYCPIDPNHPVARQQHLLRLSGCHRLLHSGAHGPAPQILPGMRVVTVPPEGLISRPPPARPPAPAAATPNPLPAYLLFTSGSTGEPKGVLNSHGALSSAVRSLQQLLRLQAGDRVLQFASLNWDTCFEEILPTLATGATLVIDADAHTGSHARTLELLRRRRVSVLNLPTAYWHEWVHHLRESREVLPASLHTVVIGGEAASASRLAQWRALDTAHIRLINTYGSTETSLVTHAAELHGPHAMTPSHHTDIVPIGHPLAHVQQHITEEGELWVGGPSLSMGYLDRAELTAERFVTRDVGRGPQRWYRTGDRVRQLPDRTLLHAGRLDRQIKVRGIQVDPAEIEAEILKHPRVAMAAAVGVARSEHMVVVAYIVARHPDTDDTLGATLLHELRQRLPPHLVPARLQVVDHLVYTASGKLDRAASHRLHGHPSPPHRWPSEPAPQPSQAIL